jgi:hypothetical protein
MSRESIRARVAAAEPGPWALDPDERGISHVEGPDPDYPTVAHHLDDADAAFVAASRQDIPLLLAVADAAEVLLRVSETPLHDGYQHAPEWLAVHAALAALETAP